VIIVCEQVDENYYPVFVVQLQLFSSHFFLFAYTGSVIDEQINNK